jgi:predicted ATPase
MKLRRFRVQKFKCVLDSGWVDVSDLTVLVGKNEAGKTSLLRALHKFNPFEPEAYSVAREWPRGHRGDRSDAQVVCSAEFELTEPEISQLKQITGQPPDVARVLVTRDYAGRFNVTFPASVFSEALEASELQKAHDYVVSILPTFVFMDEYRAFQGTAFLDQVKERQQLGKLTPDDEIFLRMLKIAELDLDREISSANERDQEERQYDLSDAAARLSRKIANHWKQLRYEVEFRADGQRFMTFVRDLKDKSLIRLEERSKGFQWFFSFDLILMHETRGTLKDCIILLDEPGLHLHPSAQLDLLHRLNDYAKGNTVIYTTHLPFMIELQNPERIRVISETEHGTVVKESLADTQPEAKLVLQAALGMSGRTSHFVADQNLVVGGIEDYWILTSLSDLFNRSGRAALPAEVLITPAGGAAEVTYIATLMVGQNLDVVAMYDTDPGGKTAQEKFLKYWLTRYKDKRATALSLGAGAGAATKEFSIEDLFTELFYLGSVEAVFGKQLAAAGLDLKGLPAGERIVTRLERLFESAGLKFERKPVAKALAGKIRAMRSVSELPGPTMKAAEMLFGAINKAFAALG